MIPQARVSDHALSSRRILLAYGGRVFERHPELRQRMPGTFLGNDLHDSIARANDLAAELDADRWLAGGGALLRAAPSS